MIFRHFKYEEFDSPDSPGSGYNMRDSFMMKLDYARKLANTPFRITSGYRTPSHNAAVKGSSTSSHMKGWAADIEARSPALAARIIAALYYAGVRRIGYYPSKKFIHADCDPSKPSPAFWDDT